MTTQSSQTKIWLKKLAVIPLLAGFIFLFAERVEAQEIIEIKKYLDAPIKDLQLEDRNPNDFRVKLKDVNNLKISYLNKDTIIEKSKVSEKQMNEYKVLLNAGKKHNIYKLKNVKKMQTIYSLMSEKQKNTVENISEVIPPPPPPKNNTSKIKETKKIEGIDELFNLSKIQKDSLYKYKKINRYYETIRNKKPHYVNSDADRKNLLERIFSELGSLYFNLSKEDKKKAKRPIIPHDPYIRLMKNNKVFYKLIKDLTEEDKLLIPPPPPVPNATKEELEKAKNAYEAWKKRTGNDYTIPPPPPPVKEKKENIENNLYVINNANDLFNNLTSQKKSELNKNKNYFLDGKAIHVDELMLMKPQKIKSVSVVGKSVYIISKTLIDTKNITEKSKKQLPLSFIRKANEKEDFVFNSVELVKSEKESKLDDFEKKQFLLRKTIIQATTLKENKFNFKIDGKESKINDVYKYILDNPLCEISTKKDEKNILTLNLDNFKEAKMSNNDLQNVYSNVFENIK